MVTEELSVTTRILWESSSPKMRLAKLKSSENADVCVLGAGIAGISVAYHLAKAGRSVVVLDAGESGMARQA